VIAPTGLAAGLAATVSATLGATVTEVSAAAAQPDDGGSVSIGTLLLYVLGALALALFSSLGILARMRDRAVERKREERAAASAAAAADDRSSRGRGLPGREQTSRDPTD
jgi:hypothetical protein